MYRLQKIMLKKLCCHLGAFIPYINVSLYPPTSYYLRRKKENTMEKKIMYFSDLHQEIQLKIIEYCGSNTILKSVSLVSKSMNVLSRDSSVGLNIGLSKATKPEIVSKIFHQRSNQIHNLRLNEISEETLQVVISLIGCLTNLKKFIANGEAMKLPKDLIVQLFHLKKLQIVHINCSLDCSSLMTISECKKLKDLRISTENVALSKEEFMTFVNLGDIAKVTLLLNLRALNFDAEEYPANNNAIKNCDLFIMFHVKTLTFSLAKAIAAYFPEAAQLYFFSETVEFVNHEYILAIRHLFQRCEKLTFFASNCRVDDKVKFERTFKEWNVDGGKDSHFITMMKKKQYESTNNLHLIKKRGF